MLLSTTNSFNVQMMSSDLVISNVKHIVSVRGPLWLHYRDLPSPAVEGMTEPKIRHRMLL